MSDYFSEFNYDTPKKENLYLGKVYVLIGGVTFSGGAELASMLKFTNRAVFIGDETAGAYDGNVSGYSKTIKLPNSKIKVDIPMVQFNMNVTPDEAGYGVKPDYEVGQTQEDYINGKNSRFEFTLKLIEGEVSGKE